MLNAFCHISEYGVPAYRKLPALVAISGTLNLWAPSSVWLGQSGVTDREFINLVESGHIRVLGRERWLTDPSFRAASAANWKPAAWTESVDGPLKRLLERGCEHVIVAPPERGRERAEQLADEDPAAAEALYQAYISEDPSFEIPVGVRESVERGGRTPDAVVRSVLRDVVNHADAFRLSQAARPMFLSPNPHSQFIRAVIRILDEAADDPASSQEELRRRPTPDERLASIDPDEEELARQLLDLVVAWDEHTLNRDLVGFMKHGGHKALSSWFEQLLSDIQEDGCSNLDGIVARRLERDMQRHTPGGQPATRNIRILTAGAEIAGLATAIAGFAADPTGAISISGLGTAAFDGGLTQLQRTGWIKPGYEGTQWPFIYMFGTKTTKTRHQAAMEILSRIRSRPASG